MLLRFIIFQRFLILHFHVFSVTRCHHSYNELASFAFFVFVRHTTHCFLLLVCYMFCGWKHCPEEAHLNRWAKHWLIIKYNHQKSLFICLFEYIFCMKKFWRYAIKLFLSKFMCTLCSHSCRYFSCHCSIIYLMPWVAGGCIRMSISTLTWQFLSVSCGGHLPKFKAGDAF